MSDPEDLIEALRAVMRSSRTADLDALDLGDDIRRLRDLASRLGGVHVEAPRMQAALRESEMTDRLAAAAASESGSRLDRAREVGLDAFFPYSPVVGPMNPIAPPVALDVVAGEPFGELTGEVVFDAVYNGPPNGVHGGIIAAVLDEMLGSVCVVNDVAGFTGTLELRYRSVTPIGEPIRLRAWVDRVEGRKTFAKGTFHHGDTLCVEADGVFIGFNPFGGSDQAAG